MLESINRQASVGPPIAMIDALFLTFDQILILTKMKMKTQSQGASVQKAVWTVKSGTVPVLVVVGCSGLYWDVLGCTGLYWSILDLTACTGI